MREDRRPILRFPIRNSVKQLFSLASFWTNRNAWKSTRGVKLHHQPTNTFILSQLHTTKNPPKLCIIGRAPADIHIKPSHPIASFIPNYTTTPRRFRIPFSCAIRVKFMPFLFSKLRIWILESLILFISFLTGCLN